MHFTRQTQKNRTLHFIRGVAAAGLATALPKNQKIWRWPLMAASVMEVTRGLRRQDATMEWESAAKVAPQKSHSGRVGDILMRWEDHNSDASTRPPVIMVHGIPTNPRLWRYVIPSLTEAGVRCMALIADAIGDGAARFRQFTARGGTRARSRTRGNFIQDWT